jgi:hypothetical protein
MRSTALTAFGNYLDSILPFGKLILTVLNGAGVTWSSAPLLPGYCSRSENHLLAGTLEVVQSLRALEPLVR